jgi:general secretion pathway protein E
MEAGSILVKRGLLSSQQLAQVRRERPDATRLDVAAVDMGLVSEEEALKALGDEVGIPFVDLEQQEVDVSLLAGFPPKLIHRHSLFPISRNNGTLTVATSDPFDLYPLDELSATTGLTIEPVLASREQIARRIKTHLGIGGETIDDLLALQEDEDIQLLDEAEIDAELAAEAREASVVRLVNEILIEAVEARASDVHIESQAAGIKIRYRIDGILHNQPAPPEINRFQAAIISRLKIMARLNIAEKRLPQDGRIKLRIQGREIDVRVSVIPMLHGEGIVMRLLDKGRMEFMIKSLGMEPDMYDQYKEIITMPHGIVLVTGPTGSGKTTTLYSSLNEIKDDETKIITTEDPVEYQLEGINQIQVHAKIGFTFAASLRAILRHDPDIVLVGEIRDFETAENAIQASLTGHLVFSTLHTNDAPSAYTRLVDMGVEPFLVASTIEGVMAQRLVRRLCSECRQAYTPDRADLPKDFPWDDFIKRGEPLYRQSACRSCRNFGFTGRQGIFELCLTNDEIRTLAQERASSWKIAAAARKNGMRTLREDAWAKVLKGITTVDEVLRATKGDRG